MTYTPKTQKTDQSVFEYLDTLETRVAQDCYQILEYMSEISQQEPQMWGESIIGF